MAQFVICMLYSQIGQNHGALAECFSPMLSRNFVININQRRKASDWLKNLLVLVRVNYKSLSDYSPQYLKINANNYYNYFLSGLNFLPAV